VDALGDRFLHLLGQIIERSVAVDALQVAQHVIGQTSRRGPQRLDGVDDGREEDGANDIGGGFGHGASYGVSPYRV
jgi:hypothetical protein